jgi:AcrR family transcriptional regulator
MTERSATRAAMAERILATTDRLFYGQGIRAIGVDTVAAEIGISKRTLYNYFPSKDALIAAYLARRLKPYKPVKPSELLPAEQILADFDRLERVCASAEFRGCPFVNAVAELGQEVPEINRLAIAFKERRRLWFRDLLSRLGVADAAGVATQLALLLDGAIAASLVRGDPAFVRAAREAAVTLIEAGSRKKKKRRRDRL